VAEDCGSTADAWKSSEVLATAEFGPAGAAMVGPPDNASYMSYVLDPKTGGLKYTSIVYTGDSALQPANPRRVLLGANQVYAYYLLDTDKTDYVLTALHDPGSETHYGFNAYWAITE
jgi:hypothetical protein